MTGFDAFTEIARYYDRIMDYVNYDRWQMVTTQLAELLPSKFVHVDAGCGTGTLLKRLRRMGWPSVGADLSLAMVQAGRALGDGPPSAVADLRALPFHGSVDYITCLFDTVNFVLDLDAVGRVFEEVADALKPGGLFYFDVVTERMVTEYFEDQTWTEDNGRFSTTWKSTYCRKTSIAETEVRVTSGAGGVFRERVYEQADIERKLAEAGLAVLAAYDARNWREPGRRTVRIDFVATKGGSHAFQRAFRSVRTKIRLRLQ